MEALSELLRYLNLVVLAALAATAVRRWRQGGRGAGWVALAFGALALLFAFRIVLRELPPGDPRESLLKLLIALAVLFPYLLFRFSAALAPASRRTETLLAALVLLVLVATLSLPGIPLDEPTRPAWFQAYLVAVLAEWALLFALVAVRLWSGGRGQPRLARQRMRSLALAAAGLLLAVALAALGPAERGPALDLSFRLLLLASALTFFLAFAPPAAARLLLLRPERQQAEQTLQALMAAATPEQVVASVLPPMARIAGAHALALLDRDGRPLGAHGLPAATLAALEQAPPEQATALELSGQPPLQLPLASGSALVWASPYAPVFGAEELALLRQLGALAELALERSRLYAQEQQAREVLERADELKSGFIALASHELRSPATSIYGIAELLELRAETLPPDRQAELRRHLRQEAERLVRLLDELLDLSRLEAGAIAIHPERLRLRGRLEQLAQQTAGERAAEIAIDADPELEALIDPNALERVAGNLIANALRYGKPPITITARQHDRHLRLYVEDRGPGVPSEFVPRLFERFARSTHAQRTPGGTGLGLAIAQAYAHAHGGTLHYQTAHPHGARFELILPQPRQAAANDGS